VTAPTRSAIPTTYRGTNFRSRLEARWAAFFDLVGWRVVYEVGEGDRYLPDFLVLGDWPFFVEVGPCVTRSEYAAKSRDADRSASQLGRDVLVVGVSPVAWREPDPLEHAAAGLFGELLRDPEDGSVLDWSAGMWGRCFTCRAVGVVHDYQTFALRPCGHHQGGSWGDHIRSDELEALWRHAGNDTQWQPESVGSIIRRLGR
jgi:hypothetical protein